MLLVNNKVIITVIELQCIVVSTAETERLLYKYIKHHLPDKQVMFFDSLKILTTHINFKTY